jgi:tetratricopeptide (TPR) repeat protein
MGQRVLEPKNEQLAGRLLRGQIAFQRGDYDEARTLLESVAEVAPGAANAELALYLAKTGDPERADVLLAEAFAASTPKDKRRRAWTSMQRGLLAMERGAYLLALERLQEADAELSGWWLVQEHLAEVYDRLGQHGRALAIYEELVATHGLPQHIDALAKARRHAGENADELIARAGALWADSFERMPSSAIGHGLEHELAFGDPQRAVELAEANHALRPGGDAKVALARAYVAAGRPADAIAIVRQALATPYRTVGLHRVAADAHTALGETSAAAEQLALCVAINPSCESQTHTH